MTAVLLGLIGAAPARADSFVTSPEDRARIEQALPASAPARPAKPRRLLIFTLNVGYGGHPSAAHASEAFTLMGRKTGAFETTVTADPQVFEPASLARYDAVFSTTPSELFPQCGSAPGADGLRDRGGGLMGVHGRLRRLHALARRRPRTGRNLLLIGERARAQGERRTGWIKVEQPITP